MNYIYTEALSAEQMHQQAKGWVSEVLFILDEQIFLVHLLMEHFMELSSSSLKSTSQELIERLEKNKSHAKELKGSIQNHNNQLYILLDKVDQPYQEQEVKLTHNTLIKQLNSFFHDFKEIKRNIFTVILDIMKHDKQKKIAQ
jgi:hypothetical protein